MSSDPVFNAYKATLVNLPYTDSDTVLEFSNVPAGTFAGARLVIWNRAHGSPGDARNNGEMEIVTVDSNDGTTVTVSRGQEDTPPIAFGASGNWVVVNAFTMNMYNNIWSELSSLDADKASLSAVARVTHDADQAVSSGSSVALAFNTTSYDSSDFHDPATNNTRLTAPEDGLYDVRAWIRWQSNSDGRRQLNIRKNGAAEFFGIVGVGASPSGNTRVNISSLVPMLQGDYIELVVFQDSGISLNVEALASENAPQMQIMKVHPLPEPA